MQADALPGVRQVIRFLYRLFAPRMTPPTWQQDVGQWPWRREAERRHRERKRQNEKRPDRSRADGEG